MLLPEGAQLVARRADLAAAPPVPMLGHVTSSYHSAALGRTFALALVEGGRERIGDDAVRAVRDAAWCRSTVTIHVLYDPEGARRDG